MKLAWLGAGLGLATSVTLVTHVSYASHHHRLSPAAESNPIADIENVYAWTGSDQTSVNLVMTVSPFDDGATNDFGSDVQYVFHVTTHPGADLLAAFAATTGLTANNVICTFSGPTAVQCWVVSADGSTVADYVSGDPSGDSGVASTDGKLKVFAGERSDPYYFNLGGYNNAVALLRSPAGSAAIGGSADAAGCPTISAGDGSALRTVLTAAQPEPAASSDCPAGSDCFVNANVKALVIQLDKSLLGASDSARLVSVWGSTNSAN